MTSIKDVAKELKRGKVVLLSTECGWGIVASLKGNDVLDKLAEKFISLKSSEAVILINEVGFVVDLVKDVPEIALTLLDISETPLTIQLEKWDETPALMPFFTNGIFFRKSMDETIILLIHELRDSLLFIPLLGDNFADIESSAVSFADIVMETNSRVRTKLVSGLLKFDKRGAFKVIRE